jgi:MOSC domain-containing protein YiiM
MSEIASVNVGTPRTVEFRGKPVLTSIYKAPVDGPVAVAGINLAGDEQADRRVHGGTDKAVYAYASEDYDWWSDQLGFVVGAGHFGENLTTRGVDVARAVVGEQWKVGDVLLEVSEPRMPCFKLGIRMNDPAFLDRFSASDRPGAYLRILSEGTIAAGDEVTIRNQPSHGLTVADVARIHSRDHYDAYRLLEIPELPSSWKRWATAVKDG